MAKKIDKRKNNGGHANAGRKPIDANLLKAPVTVYIRTGEIEAIGGIEEARNISLNALTKEINKKIKK